MAFLYLVMQILNKNRNDIVLFISAQCLALKLPIKEGLFKEQCPFPLRPFNIFSQLHLVTLDLVKKIAFKQRGTNLDFSTRIKLKAITGFSKHAVVLAGYAHLVIVFSQEPFSQIGGWDAIVMSNVTHCYSCY